MYYEAEQTKTKSGFFRDYKEVKKYKFKTYKEALIFCLSEQLPFFTYHVGEGITTKRKTFKNFYSLEEFKKVAYKNSFFFLGVHDHKKVNIDTYYFYLITNHLNKLKKIYNHANTIKH